MWTFFHFGPTAAGADQARDDGGIASVCRAHGCVREMAHGEGFGDRRDSFARASARYLIAQASGCRCGAARRQVLL